MIDQAQVLARLCDWFVDQIRGVDKLGTADQCQLLLVASDLGLDEQRIRRVVTRLLESQHTPESDDEPLTHQLMRQLVYTRFGVGEATRREFVRYWLNNGRFRTSDIVMMSWFVDVGLHNREHLTSEAERQFADWYLRHSKLKSDRAAAWAPYYLELAGHTDEGRRQAREVLARRQENGSWANDSRRTAGCTYSLLLSSFVTATDVADSIDYLCVRMERGLIDDLPTRSLLLKILWRAGWGSDQRRRVLMERLRGSRLFVSYSRKDEARVLAIVRSLEAAGASIWIDQGGITAGEDWPERLADNINASQGLLAFISVNAATSDYFVREILYALKRQKPVIGIRLDDAALPDKVDLMLGDIQQVAVGTPDHPELTVERVLEGLRARGLW